MHSMAECNLDADQHIGKMAARRRLAPFPMLHASPLL
jgi:hypothetical protein